MRAFALSFADASLCCVVLIVSFEISYSWFQSIWTWCFKQKIMVDWHTRKKKLVWVTFFWRVFRTMIETNEMLYNSRGWSQADKKEYKNERNKRMELENTFETELMAMTLKSHILFFCICLRSSYSFYFAFDVGAVFI